MQIGSSSVSFGTTYKNPNKVTLRILTQDEKKAGDKIADLRKKLEADKYGEDRSFYIDINPSSTGLYKYFGSISIKNSNSTRKEYIGTHDNERFEDIDFEGICNNLHKQLDEEEAKIKKEEELKSQLKGPGHIERGKKYLSKVKGKLFNKEEEE